MGIRYPSINDQALADRMGIFSLLDDSVDAEHLPLLPGVRHNIVKLPDEEFSFLHEAAIIEYHGTLFAAWYNCPKIELIGRTPIRGRRSSDGGQTWSDVEIWAEDSTGRLISCPPVFGICNDTLYMLTNTMVSADHMHSLDLYRYDEQKRKFDFLWSRPIPFKLNTNVYTLDNGKLLLPGRFAKLDEFPYIPGGLISDSGGIDAEWRSVFCQEDGMLPDAHSPIGHAECAVIAQGKDL